VIWNAGKWRLRVFVNGSNMEVQCTANQEPFVKFGIVPKVEFAASEYVAIKMPFNRRTPLTLNPAVTPSPAAHRGA
jgi:hypothetical protein